MRCNEAALRRIRSAILGAAAFFLVAAHPVGGQEPSRIAPTWQGVLNTGTVQLRIALHITAGSSGGLTATLDSLDHGAMGLPVEEVRFADGKLHLGMTRLRAQYDAVLDWTGMELVGRWKQGGADLPLRLRVVGPVEMPRRPQEPKPPFPYDLVEVKFPSRAPGVFLAGTLTRPRGSARAPAVVLLTGSGPQDRDESIAGHKPFLVLADHLTRAGIAVLRFDDRGIGGSSVGLPGATTRDFAEDALGAVAFLRAQPRIDPGAVGLLGHSEGGLVAVLAASSSPGIAFIVTMAAPGLSGARLMELQTAAVARSSGASEAQVSIAVGLNRRISAIIMQEKDNADAAARIRSLLGSQGMAEISRDAQIAQMLSPWYRLLLAYDPAPDFAKLTIPVLALNGEADAQVPAGPNLQAIRSALEAAGNNDHEIVSLPGLNHLMQPSATGSVSEYGRIEQTIDPAVLLSISRWILARFPASSP